jgi:ketosteroid isomerase-like protein
MRTFLILISIWFLGAGFAPGQSLARNEALEQEIKKLDLAHADAILRRDVEALRKLIADDAVTNHPTNKVVREREGIFEMIRNGTINYTSFVREPETFLFYKNMVVVMGHETLQYVGKPQPVSRRYTNVWMKRKGKWMLSIRHAHIVCAN